MGAKDRCKQGNNEDKEGYSSESVQPGVQLGEMNMLLLKKIEELTLHIIKQEERIKALEAKK